jgi:hypothetical protein
MAKYNLSKDSDGDFFDSYFEKPEDQAKPEAKPNVKESVSDKNTGFDEPVDNSLFEDAAEVQDTYEPSYEKPKPQPQEEDVVSAPAPKRKPAGGGKKDEPDYVDEKQGGLNYKPIILGLSGVAAVVLIYFVVYQMFFSDDVPEQVVVEKTVEAPKETLKTQQQLEKEKFLGAMNDLNKKRLGYISAMSALNSSDVAFSSILLYNEQLSVEVFARDRAKLAAFNNSLRTNPQMASFQIENTTDRPGSRGGIFALYKIDLNNGSGAGAGSGKPLTSIDDPKEWLSGLARQNSVTSGQARTVTTGRDGMFATTRMEVSFRGSAQNLQSVMDTIFKTYGNFKIYKLVYLPTNQRDFSRDSYQLNLTADFYL